MTDDEKVVAMVDCLTTMHLRDAGGYPYDYEWFGDTLVVAELHDPYAGFETELVKYERSEMIAVHDRATAIMAEDDIDLADAVLEAIFSEV